MLELRPAPESRAALVRRGWAEDRRVDVSGVLAALRSAGYRIDPVMEEVLSCLAGIEAGPVNVEGTGFKNDEPFVVDPLGVGLRHLREANDLAEWFGAPFCPLGWWLCRSHVYFTSGGLVVASLPGVVWHVGDTLSRAIDFMLLADGPLVRLWSMDGLGG
ncbi:hypothetical protein HII36_03840 [Nonomuraea sp. NN258]|uniref:SUKH-3 domain-containing protein n=1 Tax=Nonomuraea antri TaxID=2730852 RepID=UPI00156993E3|nr:SUKH-3 domain-containing protein [Nonomuraea antri]NRQ30965.1 hypothetical protein [Nonomuraea antri]